MTKSSHNDHKQHTFHYVRGVVHPPGKKHPSYMGHDLRAEEIDFVVRKWRHIPVYLEHDHAKGSIGWVSHFEKGGSGELIAHMMISTKSKVGQDTIRGMMDHTYQELSLGQFSVMKGGAVTRIKPAEVTICRKGARDGTSIQWFTDATQKQVLSQIYKSELAAVQQPQLQQQQQQQLQQQKQIANRDISATVDNRKPSKMNPEIDALKSTLQKQQEMLQQLLAQQQQQQQPALVQQQQQQPALVQQQQQPALVQQQQQQQQQPALVQQQQQPVLAGEPSAPVAALPPDAAAAGAPVQQDIPIEHMTPEQFIERYGPLIKKLGGYAPNGDPEEFVRIVDSELNRQQEQKMEEFRKQVELIHESGGFGPNIASTDDVVRMVQDAPQQLVGVFASVASNYREKERQYQAAQQELETVKSKVNSLQQKADMLENTLKRTQQIGLASHKERFPSSSSAASSSVQPVAAAAASALAATQTMQNLMRGSYNTSHYANAATTTTTSDPQSQYVQPQYAPPPVVASSYPLANSSSLVYAPPKESIFDTGLVNNSDLTRSAVRSAVSSAAVSTAATTGKSKYADPMFVGDKVEQVTNP